MDVLGWIFLIIIAILGSYLHIFYFGDNDIEDVDWKIDDLIYSKFWMINLPKVLPHFIWFMFSFFCIFYIFTNDYSSNGLSFINFFVLFVGVSTLAFLIGHE